LAAVGCQAVQSPTSSVVAQMGPAAASPAPWLESATLTYVHSPAVAAAPATASPAADGVIQASHEVAASGTVKSVSDSSAPDAQIVQVLAVRYPHPDGRRDFARAELVLADAKAPSPDAEGWRAKLGRFIDSATPGVEWGPGIRDAKGLDVSIVELQMMLATAEKAASSPKTPPLPTGVNATVEINGKNIAPSPAAALKLRILAIRVAREGKVISYPGGAAELVGAAAATNVGAATAPVTPGEASVKASALAASSP
jgi:hypothetical protein